MVPWANPSPQPKWQLDWLGHFCRGNQQTDRHTDEATAIATGHIFALLLLLLLLHPFNGLFSWTTWLNRYEKGKTSLDLNEARDDGVLGCSDISWTRCKQSAPRFRQITTPTLHQSFGNAT